MVEQNRDQVREKPVLRINVRQIADKLESPDDQGLEGVYSVEFTTEVVALSMQKRASIALDIFHAHQAIDCLEDFEIQVIDDAGMAIDEDDSHVAYSASDAGGVSKMGDVPGQSPSAVSPKLQNLLCDAGDEEIYSVKVGVADSPVSITLKLNKADTLAFGELSIGTTFFDHLSGEFWTKKSDTSAVLESGGGHGGVDDLEDFPLDAVVTPSLDGVKADQLDSTILEQHSRQFLVTIHSEYVPEDGDQFDALVSALEHFEIVANVVEVSKHKCQPEADVGLAIDADPQGARLFWKELIDSVETLTEISEEYGTRTLVDLMYLQNAILSGGFIDHYPGESSVMEIVNALPSSERWMKCVKVEYLTQPHEGPYRCE